MVNSPIKNPTAVVHGGKGRVRNKINAVYLTFYLERFLRIMPFPKYELFIIA
jgi:hypothetical protein